MIKIVEQQQKSEVGSWKSPCQNVSIYHHLPPLLLIYSCSQSSYLTKTTLVRESHRRNPYWARTSSWNIHHTGLQIYHIIIFWTPMLLSFSVGLISQVCASHMETAAAAQLSRQTLWVHQQFLTLFVEALELENRNGVGVWRYICSFIKGEGKLKCFYK